MASSIAQAKNITLKEVKRQFDLKLLSRDSFFQDWPPLATELTELESAQLNRLQQNYANLYEYRHFSKEFVKMVVLSPLLDLAGFYQAPFRLLTEESVEIVSVDEGTTVKGKIDALVVKQRLWVLVIESKSTQYDVIQALPQALVYMLGAPNKTKPVYGLLINGREFVFLKLSYQPEPVCTQSFPLLIDRDTDLLQVLSMLKHLRQIVIEGE